MKSGQTRYSSAAVNYKQKRFLYLLHGFFAAVVIGSLVQLSVYKVITIGEIKQAVYSLPTKWNRLNLIKYFEESKNVDENLEQESTITAVNNTQLILWEEPTLLKINFTWLLNSDAICNLNLSYSKDLRIMPILVHTARAHFNERLVLRKTWGSLSIYRNWDIRFVFLMGESDGRPLTSEDNRHAYEEQKKMLKEEQDAFGDLVIGSFVDTYHNLTYKHLMGYKWVLNFCQNAVVVLKVDDDVFIDIFQWLDWLTEDLKAAEANTVNYLSIPNVYCKIWAHARPFRNSTSKWYISYKEFPKTHYPPFCSGWAYSIDVALMKKVYLASNSINFNWIDDVFVTGQLFQLVKNKYNHPLKINDISSKVTMNPKSYKSMCRHNKQAQSKRMFKVISKVQRGKLFENDMMCMWNKTLQDVSKHGRKYLVDTYS